MINGWEIVILIPLIMLMASLNYELIWMSQLSAVFCWSKAIFLIILFTISGCWDGAEKRNYYALKRAKYMYISCCKFSACFLHIRIHPGLQIKKMWFRCCQHDRNNITLAMGTNRHMYSFYFIVFLFFWWAAFDFTHAFHGYLMLCRIHTVQRHYASVS